MYYVLIVAKAHPKSYWFILYTCLVQLIQIWLHTTCPCNHSLSLDTNKTLLPRCPTLSTPDCSPPAQFRTCVISRSLKNSKFSAACLFPTQTQGYTSSADPLLMNWVWKPEQKLRRPIRQNCGLRRVLGEGVVSSSSSISGTVSKLMIVLLTQQLTMVWAVMAVLRYQLWSGSTLCTVHYNPMYTETPRRGKFKQDMCVLYVQPKHKNSCSNPLRNGGRGIMCKASLVRLLLVAIFYDMCVKTLIK